MAYSCTLPKMPILYTLATFSPEHLDSLENMYTVML